MAFIFTCVPPAFTNAPAVVPPRIKDPVPDREPQGKNENFLWDRQFELMEAEGQLTDESFLVTVWRSKWVEEDALWI